MPGGSEPDQLLELGAKAAAVFRQFSQTGFDLFLFGNVFVFVG